MLMALSGNNKADFVKGVIKKPSKSSGNLVAAWECNNDIIASWILNSISKGIAPSIVYNGSIKMSGMNFMNVSNKVMDHGFIN